MHKDQTDSIRHGEQSMNRENVNLLGGRPNNALFWAVLSFAQHDFCAFGSAMKTEDIVFTVSQGNWK